MRKKKKFKIHKRHVSFFCFVFSVKTSKVFFFFVRDCYSCCHSFVRYWTILNLRDTFPLLFLARSRRYSSLSWEMCNGSIAHSESSSEVVNRPRSNSTHTHARAHNTQEQTINNNNKKKGRKTKRNEDSIHKKKYGGEKNEKKEKKF